MKPEVLSNLDENIDLDYVILPKTHSSMYLMHKYWARKPANIVSEYIKKYTQPGEIVLDPFMGSGVSVLESIFSDRKAIGIDINPVSIFICKNSGISTDLRLMEHAFHYLQQEVEKENSLYKQLYQIRCPTCKNNAEITHIIWENNYNNEVSPQDNDENFQSKILEIRLLCSKCGERIYSDEDPEYSDNIFSELLISEQTLWNSFEKDTFQEIETNFVYPNNEKFLQLRHNLRSTPTLSSLFTKRAIMFLLWLKTKIDAFPSKYETIQDTFRFMLTSALGQASKMVWVIDKRNGKKLKKKQVGSWTHHFFWNPKSFFEVNAWNCFQQRYRKISRGKAEVNKRNIKSSLKFDLAPKFEFLDESHPVLLLNQSIIHSTLPDNSVDFIFSDPPYGDSIQYGELSSLWAAWLGFNMEEYTNQIFNDEIIINTKQNKTLENYHAMLYNAFSQAYRILREDRYMVLTFHNTSSQIRNALIDSVLKAGFDLKQILFQLPPRVSIKSMLHHEGSPIGDYFIRFQKLAQKGRIYYPKYCSTLQSKSEDEIISILVSILTEILQKRGEPTLFVWITNLIDEFLYRFFLFPLPKIDEYIQKIRNQQIFSISENGIWWIKNKSALKGCATPLTQRIDEFLTQNVPKNTNMLKVKSKKQFYFNLVYQQFRGVLTPDKFLVNSLIQQKMN